MRGRVLVMVAVIGAVGAGCGEDELGPEEVQEQLGASCSARAAEKVPKMTFVAGDDFISRSEDDLTIYNPRSGDTFELIEEMSAGKDQQPLLDELATAIGSLGSARISTYIDIKFGNYDEAAATIERARTTMSDIDRLTTDLGVPECGAKTWIGDWFDQAETVLEGERAANAPTGDFAVDLGTVCARFVTDTLREDLDVPGADAALSASLWETEMHGALDRFVEGLDALPIPADREDDADGLRELAARLRDEASATADASSDAEDTSGLVLFAEGLRIGSEVVEAVKALGIDCKRAEG